MCFSAHSRKLMLLIALASLTVCGGGNSDNNNTATSNGTTTKAEAGQPYLSFKDGPQSTWFSKFYKPSFYYVYEIDDMDKD